MTSGSAAAAKGSAQQQGHVRLTLHCWLVGVVGCMGGLSFGYEGPVVSGLIVQPSFLHTFDPGSNTHALISQQSSYCKLHSAPLQLYISCSFITAAMATAAAATWADRYVSRRRQFAFAASCKHFFAAAFIKRSSIASSNRKQSQRCMHGHSCVP